MFSAGRMKMREKSAAPFVAACATVLKIAEDESREDEIIQLIDNLLTVLRRGEPKDDYFERKSREVLADSNRKYFQALAGMPRNTHAGTRTKQ
jgi:hypothetical protein